MPHRRHETLDSSAPRGVARRPFPIGVGLRRALEAGYDLHAFRADLLAGCVVGIVALPLAMALAIAVGVPPEHGLHTAIVAGAVAALLGGSKFQVTGPTAAFVVVLAPIVSEHGLGGLLTAGLLAGAILIAMGALRLGKLVHLIPYPVTTGFTAGIATVIAGLQLKDALGLDVGSMPEGLLGKLAALWAVRDGARPAEIVVAASTLGMLIVLPRWIRRVPAPLIALSVAGVVVWAFDIEVATLGTRFHGVSSSPPRFALPWGDAGIGLGEVQKLLPAAFSIAMLGAIESLLSAVVADGMTGKRHDPDAELIGQGFANVAAAAFGGIAATGALARTATNIRAGARSPISAIVHSVVVLAAVLLLAPMVAYLPMASLAALLLLVAWNMSDLHHVRHILSVAPRSDVFVLATCYTLTVVFDMVVAVSVGVVLASVLFLRRMAELTQGQVIGENGGEETDYDLPPGVVVYEVSGALFFGAAQHAMSALHAVRADVHVVVLGLGRVPVIDATGLVALESALDELRRQGVFVILAGPLPSPRKVFQRSELEARLDHLLFAVDLEQGLEIAADLVRLNPAWHVPVASVPVSRPPSATREI